MKFSENEKALIKELVKYDNLSQSTIGKFLNDRIFTPDKGLVIMALAQPSSPNCTIFFYDPKRFKNAGDLAYKVVESLLIFNKLEKMGLVTMLQFPTLPRDVFFVGCREKGNISSKPGIAVEFKDSSQYITRKCNWVDERGNIIYNSMKLEGSTLNTLTLFNSIIWVSSELIELVEHDFQTEDYRRFKEQQKLTWIAIGIAIVVPILISLFGTTKINSAQLEQVTNKIESANQSINKHITGVLDEMNSNDMRRDSILMDISKRVGTKKK